MYLFHNFFFTFPFESRFFVHHHLIGLLSRRVIIQILSLLIQNLKYSKMSVLFLCQFFSKNLKGLFGNIYFISNDKILPVISNFQIGFKFSDL